jgi:hypothetical protein
MLQRDEIAVFVVDEKGNPLEKHLPVQWSGDLREGQDLPLKLEGPEGRVRLFRVLGVRPGAGQGRFVQVIEVVLRCPFCEGRLRDEDGLAGLEQDEKGAFVTCRHCRKRVAMEQVPVPRGGPAVFHVASGQEAEEPGNEASLA